MKNKKLFIDFIVDNVNFTLVYFINTSVLLLFFYLYYDNAEILYPLCLSLFIFIICIMIKWIKYKSFNMDIYMNADNAEYKVRCFTKEEKRTAEAIKKLHLSYGHQLSDLKINNREHRRLLSQFIHSLKSPVTVIDIAASNLQNADFNKEEARNNAVCDIRMQSDRITSTLDKLLSLLRLEEFEMDYTCEAVNLAESLNEIINSMKKNFIYGKVVPKVQCIINEPIVYTDYKWNKIMLEQFISNGIKYSMPGENMKALLFTINKTDNYITLTIKDEGIGIPEYDLDRITEAFFTGENGRRVKNSSGIGLYIAKKISEKLNHKIEIKSKVNEGTEIKITYLSKV